MIRSVVLVVSAVVASSAAAQDAQSPAAFGHGDGYHAKKAVDHSKAQETPFGRAGNPAKAAPHG